MAARDFGIPFDWLSLFKVGDRIVPFQDNPATIYVYFGCRTAFRLGGSGDRRTVCRSQRVFENPLPNAFALDIPCVHRGREVNPAKDTRCTIFSRCFRKTPELAGNARRRKRDRSNIGQLSQRPDIYSDKLYGALFRRRVLHDVKSTFGLR